MWGYRFWHPVVYKISANMPKIKCGWQKFVDQTQSSNSEKKVGGIVGIKIDQIMEPCEYMGNCDSW